MTATAERDITRPFLDEADRTRYRHVNSDYGRAIANGMRTMRVYQGTFNEAAYLKRRTRNRAARKSRRINRR
jgi:hypothetical protein